MNEMQIFENPIFGQLRTIEIDGEPWFVGKDVAMALGYKKSENAIKAHVDDEDKTTTLIQGTGSNYKSKTVIINESGMYALIFGSKLPDAKEFKHWVVNEIMPQIRNKFSENNEKTALSNDFFSVIEGVRCYEENGTVYLNLEDVARGLGFTTVAASCNEAVRWNTVYKYLVEFGVATNGNEGPYKDRCPEYIPENVFYRLAMRAKSKGAEQFQAKIADEVIPQIRKTGGYIPIKEGDTDADIRTRGDQVTYNTIEMKKLNEQFAEMKQMFLELSNQIQEWRPKVETYDDVMSAEGASTMNQIAKEVGIGEYKLFKFLRDQKVLFYQGPDNVPYERFCEAGYFVVIPTKAPDGSAHSTTRVTQKGMEYISKLLRKNNIQTYKNQILRAVS